jgi:hypothetical protein
LQLNELHPDKFDPKIVTKTADYVYVEYQSPTFGFTDDVEFYFPDVSPCFGMAVCACVCVCVCVHACVCVCVCVCVRERERERE